jgi:hypothetical protein
MIEEQTTHVAIAPPEVLEQGLVEEVASVLNKETSDTRLLLAGIIPKIVAHCQDRQAADLMAEKLRGLGLAAIAVGDPELYGQRQRFDARTIEFHERAVLFRDKQGQVRKMEAENVFLILKGRTRSRVEAKDEKTKTKLNLPATLLTGGIPIWRTVRERTTDPPVSSQQFAWICERHSWETSVEIPEAQVDYSFLGAEMASSSTTNFETLIARLRRAFPQAIFDDRLTRYPAARAASPRALDSIEVRLRLVYIFHVAQTTPGTRGGWAKSE